MAMTQKPGAGGGDPGKRLKEGNKALEGLAKEALEAFRTDAKDAYAQLVKDYDGTSAVVAVLGLGVVTVAVSKGNVHFNPEAKDTPKVIGRGGIYPETVVALAEGRLTVLEAFHKGELLARAHSEQLHRAYGLFVKFSDAALKSERLQKVLKEFRDTTGV